MAGLMVNVKSPFNVVKEKREPCGVIDIILKWSILVKLILQLYV